MIRFIDFVAPTIDGAVAQANDWLQRVETTCTVVNIETVRDKTIRVWTLGAEPVAITDVARIARRQGAGVPT